MNEEEQNKKEGEAGAAGQEVQSSVPPTKDRFLATSILIAAVVLGGAIIFSAFYRGGSGASNQNPGTAQNQGQNQNQNQPVRPPMLDAKSGALGARDVVLGKADAPVTVIEYGDYQCPFCAQYFQSIQPQIVAGYANTGKAKFVFRNFAFLGSESIAAAEAAECAIDQNKFWPYHDALYAAKVADYQKGGAEDDGSLNRSLFLKIAGNIGLNVASFTKCIDANTYAALVGQEKSDATAAGVNSTPSTFVNNIEVAGPDGNSVGADPTSILNAIAAAAK